MHTLCSLRLSLVPRATKIKAFGFLGCTPRRPFRLTGKARRDAHLRLAGENPSITASGTTAGLNKVGGARVKPRHGSRSGGGEDENCGVEAWQGDEGGCREGDTGITGRSHSRKMVTCGMCGVLLSAEEVSCKMTAKMIRETLMHVSWQYSMVGNFDVPPRRVPASC